MRKPRAPFVIFTCAALACTPGARAQHVADDAAVLATIVEVLTVSVESRTERPVRLDGCALRQFGGAALLERLGRVARSRLSGAVPRYCSPDSSATDTTRFARVRFMSHIIPRDSLLRPREVRGPVYEIVVAVRDGPRAYGEIFRVGEFALTRGQEVRWRVFLVAVEPDLGANPGTP